MTPKIEVLHSFRNANKLYEKLFEDVRSRYHVTQTEIDVIAFLKNNPQFDTAKEIVNYRNLPKANVSQAVESLFGKGCLRRRPDALDRRLIHLEITEEATALLSEILEVQKRYDQYLFEGITQEERNLFAKVLCRVAANVTEKERLLCNGKEK